MLTKYNMCLWFDFSVVLTKLCGNLRHGEKNMVKKTGY